MTMCFSRELWFQRWSVFVVGLSVLILAGCGGEQIPTGTVQGKVLLGDAPYADAAIMFLSPDSGNGASVNIQAGGTFKIETPLPVGSYTVYLAPKIDEEESDGEGGEGAQGPVDMVADKTVPDKYWSESTSDITIVVKEGDNNVTIKLSTE